MGRATQDSCGKTRTRIVLKHLAFAGGFANPRCFHHKERDLLLVVHGDDFITLGTRASLTWFEEALAHNFEIKIRRHIGEGPGCLKETRVLNRIVRLTSEGIRYESDPMHAELLLKSLDVVSNSAATPGHKDKENDMDAVLADDLDLERVLAHDRNEDDCNDHDSTSIPINAVRVRCVDFAPDVETHFVPAYADHYGVHPSSFGLERDGRKKLVSPSADPIHWEIAEGHGLEMGQAQQTPLRKDRRWPPENCLA